MTTSAMPAIVVGPAALELGVAEVVVDIRDVRVPVAVTALRNRRVNCKAVEEMST